VKIIWKNIEKINLGAVIDEIYMDDGSYNFLNIEEPNDEFAILAENFFNAPDLFNISPDIINKVNSGLANSDNIDSKLLRFLNSDDSSYSDIIEKDPKCKIPNSVTPDDEMYVEGSSSTKIASQEEFEKRVEQDSKAIIENDYVVQSVNDSDEFETKISVSENEITQMTGNNNTSKYINYSVVLLVGFLLTLM